MFTAPSDPSNLEEKPSLRWKRRFGKVYHGVKELIFGGRHFCCCIPTRLGVVVGSCLQFLIAGALAIILWFEVSTQHDFTFSHLDRVGFICAGLLETLLFVAAVIGFIGAIVRKQLFVTLYCGFLYVHFLINLGAAAFLTWKINHTTSKDVRAACEQGIRDPGAQDQCKGLLGTTRSMLLFVMWVVIVVEFYGVLIVTRYTRQLRSEKRHGRGTYTTLGSEHSPRQRTRVASRRRFTLTDDLDEEDDGVRSPMHTPGSAGSGYKNAGATFFPTMPSIPNSTGEKRYSEEEKAHGSASEEHMVVGGSVEKV